MVTATISSKQEEQPDVLHPPSTNGRNGTNRIQHQPWWQTGSGLRRTGNGDGSIKKLWYQKNQKRERTKHRGYYHEHHDQERARSREYYVTHHAAVRDRQRRYYQQKVAAKQKALPDGL